MDSPIKGFVKCGGCKHNMQRRSRLNVSYYCRYYYEAKSKECCPENIKETELLEIVLSAIRHQAMLAGEADRLQELYKVQLCDRMKENQEKKKQLQEKIQGLMDKNFSLYERYAKGEVSVDQFRQEKENNNKLIETYKAELQVCQSKETTPLDEKPCPFNLLKEKENLTDLTKELVRQIIDAIYVYSSKRIEIVFKFQYTNYVSDRKYGGAVVQC